MVRFGWFFLQTWRSSTSSVTQVSSRAHALRRFAAPAPRIRTIWWRSRCFSPETCGLRRRLTRRLCVIFVFVAERRKLFVDLALVWGWFGFSLRSSPWISREFVLCWFWEFWPSSSRQSFSAFYPEQKSLVGNSELFSAWFGASIQ